MKQSKSYDHTPEMIISPDKDYHATFHTEKGPIRVKLFAEALKEKVAEGVPVCASSMTGTDPRPRRGCCGET